MKNSNFKIVLLLMVLLNFNNVFASSFQGQKNVTISEAVEDDLYLAGGNIIIDAPVNGDLICAGGDININEIITEDILVAGGNIKIRGVIGDDVRVAGGTVFIMEHINGDLIVTGGEVTVDKNVMIQGDIKLAAGKLLFNGTAKGKVDIRGGEINWNGVAENGINAKAGELIINGPVEGKSELAAQNIDLGTNAKFYGDVTYWTSAGELNFGEALTSGTAATYDADLKVMEADFDWRYLGLGLLAFWLYRTLAAALMIALLVWMFHRYFTRTSEVVNKEIPIILTYGLIYVIGLPLLILLAFLTIVGIPVGFILIMLYGATIALGHILAAVMIAYGIEFYYSKNWNRRTLFLVAICSYLALKMINVIPVLGFLISLTVVTTAFGAIIYAWWKNRNADIPMTAS